MVTILDIFYVIHPFQILALSFIGYMTLEEFLMWNFVFSFRKWNGGELHTTSASLTLLLAKGRIYGPYPLIWVGSGTDQQNRAEVMLCQFPSTGCKRWTASASCLRLALLREATHRAVREPELMALRGRGERGRERERERRWPFQLKCRQVSEKIPISDVQPRWGFRWLQLPLPSGCKNMGANRPAEHSQPTELWATKAWDGLLSSTKNCNGK